MYLGALTLFVTFFLAIFFEGLTVGVETEGLGLVGLLKVLEMKEARNESNCYFVIVVDLFIVL